MSRECIETFEVTLYSLGTYITRCISAFCAVAENLSGQPDTAVLCNMCKTFFLTSWIGLLFQSALKDPDIWICYGHIQFALHAASEYFDTLKVSKYWVDKNFLAETQCDAAQRNSKLRCVTSRCASAAVLLLLLVASDGEYNGVRLPGYWKLIL